MNFAFFRVQRREVAGPSAYLTCLDRDVRRQNEKSDGGRCRYFSRFARVERLATESAAMNQAESELSPMSKAHPPSSNYGPKLNARLGQKWRQARCLSYGNCSGHHPSKGGCSAAKEPYLRKT